VARILVLNNYPLDVLLPEVRAGRVPDSLIYGVEQMARAGHDLRFVPFAASSALQRLSRLLWRAFPLLPLGDLDQQWSCLKQLNGADLIYAPCQTQTAALGYLRALGWLNTPVVALAHHCLNYGRLAAPRERFIRAMLRGVDAFPSLSRMVATEINTLAPGKSRSLVWGPPRSFYPPADGPGSGIVAAGRTGRDFVTLGRAASRTSVITRIVCLQGAVQPDFSEFSANVQLTVQPNDKFMSYAELIAIYSQARALAIPLHVSPQSLAGLTSLTDALGMGKPVIMTRHPLIDLDIEAEGVGFWVEPGDVEGWCERIAFLDGNPSAALEMGRRATQLVASRWNSNVFARDMIGIISDVLSRR
jgi:glycosyltransferase involved in cell wall biosynthesis